MSHRLNESVWIAAFSLLVSGCQSQRLPSKPVPVSAIGTGIAQDMMRQDPCAAKSPDGRHVAFFEAGNGPRPHVVVKNADGSHPVRFEPGPLSDDNTSTPDWFEGSSESSELAWSPNGKALAFIERRTVRSGSYAWSDRVCLLTLRHGRFRGVEIPAWLLGNLKWSRDSKHVLLKAAHNVFLPGGEKKERSERWRVEAATGKTKKLTP